MAHMRAIADLAAPKGKSSGGGKMELKRLEVEPAVNGFVVRCHFERGGKNMEYDTKVKVFEDAEKMAEFIGTAFDGGNPGDKESDEDY